MIGNGIGDDYGRVINTNYSEFESIMSAFKVETKYYVRIIVKLVGNLNRERASFSFTFSANHDRTGFYYRVY